MATIDNEAGKTSWRTAALMVAPAVLLAALVAHPYVAGRLALWPLAYATGTEPVPAAAARPAPV